MIQKLKAMGLAFVAIFAMSAVAAAGAQAAEFHSSAEVTKLSAGQTTTHKFTVGSGFGAITCTGASFSGTQEGFSTTSVTITPAYSGCTDSLGRKATVNVGSAQYQFINTGTVNITSQMSIQIKNASEETKCTVTVPAQNGVGPVSYKNNSGNVLVTSEANNIETSTSGGLLNCGVSNGTHTGGTYTGTSDTSGKDLEGKAATLSFE